MARRRFVLFLGAGASVPFGYPTTDGILERIQKAIRPGIPLARRPGWLRKVLERHPRLCAELREGLSLVLPGRQLNGKDNNASIIDVLSIVDYLLGAHLSLAPDFREAELRRLRHHIGICMNGVLRETRKAPELRQALLDWMVQRTADKDCVSIVTTNYDCLYDLKLPRALGLRGGKIFEHVDFGTTVMSPSSREYRRPANARLAVYKLHGSLNWLRCEVCGGLYVNPKQRIVSLAYWKQPTKYNTCKCGGRLTEILVAPSLIRDIRNPHLLSNWNAALSDLREAAEWIFIGYSLPQEDISIRALLLRALHGRARKRLKVRVALWDQGEQFARMTPKQARELAIERDPFAEKLAARTLKRYRDFLPAEHFRGDRDD